ncbi:hypothetical protein TNCV_1699261 [Trichonephila clavipes]|nr:hypothetical protein TNCV_1699261 [Trichonephila clavipes]
MVPIDAFPEHISTTVVPVTLPYKPDALEYDSRQGQVRAGIIYQEPKAKLWTLFPNPFSPAHSEGIPRGRFPENENFELTPYKLPPPTPIHIPAEKRPLEEKSLPFSKRRSKVRITLVMRRVSRRPELRMAPGQIPPVQIPHVPEPVLIPQSQEPVQIPHVPEPVQISHVSEPVQIPHVPEPVNILPKLPVKIPEPVQVLHDPEPMQIPDVPQPIVQIPAEADPLEPTDALDQLMSFVFEPPDQELQLLHTVPSIFDGDLISFLDEFERELAREPMDLTMPRLDPLCKKIYRI